jgi:hypothetical protein
MVIVDFYFKVATTKRSPKSKIVELAAVDKHYTTFVRIVNPSVQILPDATKVHRISKREDGSLWRNGARLNAVSIGNYDSLF